jgi:hypothetical protein
LFEGTEVDGFDLAHVPKLLFELIRRRP